MEYFLIQIKPNKIKPYETVCLLKENYTDYSVFWRIPFKP